MDRKSKQLVGGGGAGGGARGGSHVLFSWLPWPRWLHTTHPLPAFLPSFLLRLSLTSHYSPCAKEQKLSVYIFWDWYTMITAT